MSAGIHIEDSPVFIGPLSDSLSVWLRSKNFSAVFVLSDNNTNRYCFSYLPKSLEDYAPVHSFVIEPGESRKNLDTCAIIWSEMKNAGLDRKALVVNLGGGVIGDMGGFCAVTWKRGVEFIQIPTTLLAMTDAAIGGKTGVDFDGIKNAVGVIRQPAAVFTDPFFLKTLPDRELRSGMAEIFKHAAISGELSSGWINSLARFESSEPDWIEILTRSVSVKTDIVRKDPEEKGVRMLLNMGHTIGHAIESVFIDSSHPLTHGEAIAVGMICESYIAQLHKITVPDKDLLTDYLLKIFELPQLSGELTETLWHLMLQDKKNASGNVRITLPDAPRSMRVLNISRSDLERGLEYYNSLI
ncbi:MAG: 3-dehydroquinate synthase [Saprospiraceae bacterium]|nr:3-dehydroquinate synthase [Saprospiraceae bacterium]